MSKGNNSKPSKKELRREEKRRLEEKENKVKKIIDVILALISVVMILFVFSIMIVKTEKGKLLVCGIGGILLSIVASVYGYKEYRFSKQDGKYKQYFGGAVFSFVVSVLVLITANLV
ncbi:DUF4181 domain-containing protein [Clostridium bornimense]|uniref:DUF4181 domain-containing protein n=1 Tax=Clostridium bornimense TaxID=1216932 RepID=UPI001C0FC908|nr:DUF4181 domain-containing protein [Clostridium bornimense]MBU5316032.1 DUF4181 domain-containing protein [Clostridium bornimense]